MSLFFAKAISIIANPLVLSLPASYLLVYATEGHDMPYAYKWSVATFVVSTIVLLLITLGVRRGVFSDFDITIKKQRSSFFTLIFLTLSSYLVFLSIVEGPKILVLTTFAVATSAFIVNIITKWIKVSVHVASVTAFSVMLTLGYGGLYTLGLLSIPLTIWARIKTKRHTQKEALFGVFTGLFLTITSYFIIRRII